MKYIVRLELISDATFGRGDGVAGAVDTEIEQEDGSGLPCIKGRTLRGLIVEECSNLLESVRLQRADKKLPKMLTDAAMTLFGAPGSTEIDAGSIHIGSARLPDDLRQAILAANLKRDEVLAMTACVRSQTAIDEQTDAPLPNSLRSERAVISRTPFEAEIVFRQEPHALCLALLSASVRCVRRGGNGRNRGRGELQSRLLDACGAEVDRTPLFALLSEAAMPTSTDPEGQL